MKDQPKHTTGEWFAKQAEGRGYFEWYVGRDGEARAIASDIIDPETGQPSEANAHLIAAAPKMAEEIKQLKQENAELLEALKALVALGSLELPHQRDAAINTARAVISKKEGRVE